MKLINKDALVAEVDRRIKETESMQPKFDQFWAGQISGFKGILKILDTLEVKDVELVIHTIIAECCDWLASHTNLSRNEIEGCRNLMLTVKDEQLKAQKGE